ncbi:MAG: biopolymer transporter ExbD [Planctomycetales bacterium]|nr:biopolymer transporter ExbD [Planctomycetales bacterium]
MPLKTHHDEQPTINLTPMIDIVFLLIIFFMVGTKFSEMEPKIPVKVPEVSHAGALTAAPERRIVTILESGEVALDDQMMTVPDLIHELKLARQEYPELGVVIRGAAMGAFQNVASVLSACQAAGISEMGISVNVAGATEGVRR